MSDLNWSVVVTTAPRKKPKLKTTVQSLKAAGWNNPIVFAEPESPTCDAKTYTSENKLGVFHNWMRAARHALDSNADVIMMVQDDVWFSPDSKCLPSPHSGLKTAASYRFIRRFTTASYRER